MTRQLFRLTLILFFFSLPIGTICQLTQTNVDSLFVAVEARIKSSISAKKHSENIDYIDQFMQSDEYMLLLCQHKAMIYHRLGQVYYLLRNHKKALEIFTKKAIPIWDDCKNRDELLEANTHYAAAMSGKFLYKFDETIPNLNKSLELYESDPKYSDYKLGEKYRGAGVFYYAAGDLELAELLFLKSIPYFEKAKNGEIALGITYNDLGVIYKELKNYNKSVEYFKQDFETHISRQLLSSYNMADIYLEYLNDIENSNKYALITFNESKKSGDHNSLINANNIRGRIKFKKKNYKESIELFDKALVLCDSVIQNNPNVWIRANLHLHKAEAYAGMDDLANAKLEVNKAISLQMPNSSMNNSHIILRNSIIRDKDQLIELLAYKAELHSKQDEVDNGQLLFYKIDSLFQMSLTDISLSNSQIQASSNMSGYYKQAIKHYLDQFQRTKETKDYNSAYYFSSQLKALVLSNILRKHKVLTKEDDHELRDLRSTLSTLLVDYYNADISKDSISTEVIKAQRDIYEFEQEIQLKYSNVLNVFENSSNNNVEMIQSRLQTDELIIEYFEGEEILYTFAIGKTEVFFAEIKLTDETIVLISNFIQSCQDPQKQTITDIRNDSKVLYDILLAPLLSGLDQAYSKLVIIRDGLLHAVPFEAMSIDNSEYLLNDYNVVYSYSHSLYFETDVNESIESYVGFGPKYSAELSQKLRDQNLLEATATLSDLNMGIVEIEESANYYSNQSVYINSQATKSSFIEIAETFDILHLSMHGLVDYQVPDNSSLIFHDGTEDFVLKSAEITALDLDSDLVILSSCHSAAGAITKGEGVQGLSRAFILAGSSSVMSSLWNASEYSSSEILPSFFEKFTSGQSKSNSLRESKIEYLATARPSLQHPFYWSNYILLTHSEDTGQANFSMIAILLASLLLLALVWFFFRKSN